MNSAARILPAVLLACFLFPAACVSSTSSEGGGLVWKDGRTGPEAPEPRPTSGGGSGGSGKVVTVPQDVLDELNAFFAKPQFILAQQLEIDASRVPFKAAIVPISDGNYVSEVEVVSQELKATGYLLKSRSAAPMVERDFPRVRVYQGVDLAAAREIRVRVYSNVEESRPMFFRAVAMGGAVYRDETTGRELRQDQITLMAQVVLGPGGYEFRQSIR